MSVLRPEQVDEVVLLGAHCDDVAIGAGGAVRDLCVRRPGLRVHALVLCAADPLRRAEEEAALRALCPDAKLELTTLDIPDGRLPAHWNRAKEALEDLRQRCDPDLVLATAGHDNHQDHRGLARLAPTVFRDHLILGYEVLKAEPDLEQPAVFWPLTESQVRDKIALLHEHYPSQTSRAWFDEETFRSLVRIRGVQAGCRYAEGFHPTRLLVGTPVG
ncbi:PIG-L deacetylase family protein [Pseudonocardia pini]|uniref:PIG-L deacetylase family protein n=1 Tax=Pseudonocardia pini TaxID=2758030 RepID=UPI0015F07474|nr:PIG-L family deacetylase [Pseudonocardia pini]